MFRNKLYMPRVGSNTVRREKVEEKLRLLPDYKLAFLSAPAGYGKTTAVADYLMREGLKYAWLSLDEADNDPVRFWKYFVASVSGCLDDKGISRLSVDGELVSSNITVELLIDVLETVPENFVLVLDDCHLIDNRVIINSIEYFVRYMPRNVSLIVLSRKEPENMLSLLCARGMAIRLGIRDLAFDYDETAEFFSQNGFRLTEDEIRMLERYTEGWAAGLVAASISIRESGNAGATIRALSGRDKNISLILEQDVFNRWPKEITDFLVHTSFLNRLSASLCAAVTGNGRSGELLRLLSGSNSFVTPLDTEGRLFRYHPLFREFLQSRLECEDETVLRGLYGKAGAWFLDNGEVTEAVNWLLKAGEYEKAYPCISNYRDITAPDSDYSLWKKWVERIPEMFYADNPKIYVSYSWVSSMENHIKLAEVWSDKAFASFERIKDGLEEQEKTDVEAQVLFSDLNVAIQKADMERLNCDYDRLRGLKLSKPVLLGELNWNEPNLLKTPYGFRGRLNLVEKYLPNMEDLPRLIGDFSSYIAVAVAEFYYERNRLEELDTALAKHMGEITELNMPGIVVPSFILLAREKRARGDTSGAFRDIEEAGKLLSEKTGNVWRYHLDNFMAALYLSVGDLNGAEWYLGKDRLGLYDPLSASREFEYTVYARYLMATDRPDDALILLGRLEGFARKENRLGSRIELLCLEAVCCGIKNNYKNAMPFLEKALALGAEEGYVRTFADEGAPMAVLLKKYININRGKNNGHLPYARELLRITIEYAGILREPERKTCSVKDANGIVSLLTNRETGVLRLLAEEKTNAEIADRLSISVSAVKHCNTRIYDKLGVKNRLEAIIKASELGLTE